MRAKDERGVQATRSTSRFWFVQSDGGKKSGSEIIEHISEIKQIFDFGLKERGRNRVRQKKKLKKPVRDQIFIFDFSAEAGRHIGGQIQQS